MSFSDDDLKRLKIGACDPRLINTVEMVQALLARLEAAERIMRAEHNDDSGTMSRCISPCELCEAMEAWRKASGKDASAGKE